MAKIKPFSGLRYDVAKVGNGSDVLAPPYDVIDGERRDELASRSEYNCIKTILPEGDGDAKYEEGNSEFQKLVSEALIKDEAPAYYVYHQTFSYGGQEYLRKGFVSLIELTRFGQGPVLPHERTLASPKRDRLMLMRACDAHLELVFGMFSDPDRKWESALEGQLQSATLDCKFDGVRHQLFPVSDANACAELSRVLEDRRIYIADGHHRYETMCAFRDELAEAGRHEASAYGMIYLSNLDDPGLVVRPTHRLVHSVESFDTDALLKQLDVDFERTVVELPQDEGQLQEALRSQDGVAVFGLSVPRTGKMHVLRLKPEFKVDASPMGALPEALKKLDVVMLHELVLEAGLGIDKEAQAAKTKLKYYKSTDASIRAAREGDDTTQLVCFMNATPVSDVVDVCDSGEVMPQKTTFFYPKIPTGLVFYPLPK